MKSYSIKRINETENIYLIEGVKFGPDPGSFYLIDSDKKALIETGTSHSTKGLERSLDEFGIHRLDFIFLTHIHLDHAGGAGFLSEKFPEARIIVHGKGAKHLIDPSKLKKSVKRAVGKLFDLYGDVKPISRERIISLSGGETINLGGGFELKSIDSPGHAPHHLCYFEEKNKVLFTGDAAGIYYPNIEKLLPSTPPPNFDLEKEIATLRKLKKVPAKIIAYTHVGWRSNPRESIENYENLLVDWVSEIENLKNKKSDEKSVIKEVAEKYTPRWAESKENKEIMKEKIKMDVKGVLLYLKRKTEK